MDHVPTNLSAFIRLLRSGRNVLIPGCGEDYRTIDAFRLAGHQVTAIDFSPVAIERTNKALTEFGSQVILGDFFLPHSQSFLSGSGQQKTRRAGLWRVGGRATVASRASVGHSLPQIIIARRRGRSDADPADRGELMNHREPYSSFVLNDQWPE